MTNLPPLYVYCPVKFSNLQVDFMHVEHIVVLFACLAERFYPRKGMATCDQILTRREFMGLFEYFFFDPLFLKEK